MAISDLISGMTPETRASLELMLKHFRKTGDASAIEELYAIDYDRVPVEIDQFLEDDYYLGGCVKGLAKAWRDELREIFAPDSPITTLFITGAIGAGKTTASAICLARKLYELSCLKDPAQFYGLLPRSKIVLGIYSVTLEKADDITTLLKMYLDTSPYFRENCPRKLRPDDPIFLPTKNLEVPVGSLATHALGDNVLGFVLDEANFYKKTKAADNPNETTRAHQLFNEAQNRIVSRFSKYGSTPGFVILISSRKFQSSFLDEKIEAAQTDQSMAKTTKVISLALWQAKNPDEFSGESFDVLVGTEQYASRVLEQDEIPPEGGHVVRVPEEYRMQFQADPDLALRDIAGVSTVGSRAFFPVMERLRACIDPSRQHPFTKPEFTIKFGKGSEISDFAIERLLCRIDHSEWIPIIHPEIERHVHLDLAYSQECIGFAMGHPSVTPNALEGMYLDIMLRIRSPTSGEIDLMAPIKFVRWLKSHGYKISHVSFDQFQSRLPIQLLLQAGFNASLLSVGLMHYNHLKTGFNERRIMMYEYAPLLDEASHLQRGADGDRPGHAPGFFDDVLDAVAAVYSRCNKIASASVKKGTTAKDKVIFAGIGDRGPVMMRSGSDLEDSMLPSDW